MSKLKTLGLTAIALMCTSVQAETVYAHRGFFDMTKRAKGNYSESPWTHIVAVGIDNRYGRNLTVYYPSDDIATRYCFFGEHFVMDYNDTTKSVQTFNALMQVALNYKRISVQAAGDCHYGDKRNFHADLKITLKSDDW